MIYNQFQQMYEYETRDLNLGSFKIRFGRRLYYYIHFLIFFVTLMAYKLQQ